MTLRIDVRPELLRWPCEYGEVDPDKLRKRFPKYDDWVSGALKPTYKQIEDFVKFTHVPSWASSISDDLEEMMYIHIRDLRTLDCDEITRASFNLLETIYMCRERQQWYEEYAKSEGNEPLDFVGSATIHSDAKFVAGQILHSLKFSLGRRKRCQNWAQALRYLTRQANDLGILVMRSSIVHGNTHRKLNPQEFRAIALADELASLIFINAADTKASQMFTLVHGLALIWLGEAVLSDASLNSFPTDPTEKWCSQVALEFLVPTYSLRDKFRRKVALSDELSRLSDLYKVSTLVILRRLHDIGVLPYNEFRVRYHNEQLNLTTPNHGVGEGNFYTILETRVSRLFGQAVIASFLSGDTLNGEAGYLLGVEKPSTLNAFGKHLWGK